MFGPPFPFFFRWGATSRLTIHIKMSKARKKQSLRNELLEKRALLDERKRSSASLSVQKRFIESVEYKEAKRLALYAGCSGEVMTDALIDEAVAEGKDVFLPKVVCNKDAQIIFLRARGTEELVAGPYGIPEPGDAGLEPAKLELFDCIVVPGIAFDAKGARLGYGKGYYDRALAAASGTIVGLAFEFQLVEEVPTEPHDVRADLVITESRIIRVS